MIWYLSTLFENILWFWPMWMIIAIIFAMAVPVYVEKQTGSSWEGTKAFCYVIGFYLIVTVLTSPFWHSAS